MIALLSAILGNTVSAVVSNSLKSMMKSSTLNTKRFGEVICSISKIMVLLITISILIASIVLLFCFALNYFLLNYGFTFYQSITIIIAVKVTLIAICVNKVKRNIKQINSLGEELAENEDKENSDKQSILKNTINSFIDGFNSKK
ncbi:MAG: hypothetical protein EKK61_01120 [Rickettsiales bacterium]|nr:MAG: hypothetical protein EKK61_01120 [Rickettsiales bacterium]